MDTNVAKRITLDHMFGTGEEKPLPYRRSMQAALHDLIDRPTAQSGDPLMPYKLARDSGYLVPSERSVARRLIRELLEYAATDHVQDFDGHRAEGHLSYLELLEKGTFDDWWLPLLKIANLDRRSVNRWLEEKRLHPPGGVLKT